MEKLNCEKCKYTWEYKGNRLMATCPNCLTKVKRSIVFEEPSLNDLKQQLLDTRIKLDLIEGQIDYKILKDGDTNDSSSTE